MLQVIDFKDVSYPVFTSDTPANEAVNILRHIDEVIGFVVDHGKYIGAFMVERQPEIFQPVDKKVSDLILPHYHTELPNNPIIKMNINNMHPIPIVDSQGIFRGIVRPAFVYLFYQNFNTALLEQFGNNHVHHGLIFESNDGLIMHVNDCALKILGLDRDAISCQSLKQILPELYINNSANTPIRITKDNKTINLERKPIKLRNRDIGYIIVVEDLSNQLNISAELAYAQTVNHEIESIFRYSSEGLCIIDNSGIILKANDALCQVMLCKRSDLENQHVKELERLGLIDKSIGLAVLARKEEVTITQATKKFNHQWLTTGRPVFDKGDNVLYVVSTARDVQKINNMYISAKTILTHDNKKFTFLSNERTEAMNRAGIIGSSPGLLNIVNIALRIANTDATVLIQGESGTGKELIANLIHQHSDRKGRFVSINCGALPRELLEAELFGYVGGAFTGAKKEGKRGLFEVADKGTVFLDEIGELPLDLQVKILRAVEYGELSKIGGSDVTKFDARIIAATNRDLNKMVEEGSFREDLYYRLSVVPIFLPPLRERKDDVRILIDHFLKLNNEKYQMNKEFSLNAHVMLNNYSWPGNIRELKNLIERLVLTTEGDIIPEDELPAKIVAGASSQTKHNVSLREALESVERRMVLDAYKNYGSSYKVAEVLDISQSSAVRKLSKYLEQK